LPPSLMPSGGCGGHLSSTKAGSSCRLSSVSNCQSSRTECVVSALEPEEGSSGLRVPSRGLGFRVEGLGFRVRVVVSRPSCHFLSCGGCHPPPRTQSHVELGQHGTSASKQEPSHLPFLPLHDSEGLQHQHSLRRASSSLPCIGARSFWRLLF